RQAGGYRSGASAASIGSGSVVQRARRPRAPDANGLEDVGPDQVEKSLPVVHAVHPAVEPRAVAFHRPAFVVESSEELVVAPIAALHRGRRGAEWLVNDRGDLDVGRQHEPWIGQDLLARANR